MADSRQLAPEHLMLARPQVLQAGTAGIAGLGTAPLPAGEEQGNAAPAEGRRTGSGVDARGLREQIGPVIAADRAHQQLPGCRR